MVSSAQGVLVEEKAVGQIPIRNLWFLLVYAWDLGAFAKAFAATVEASPDLPHLVVALFTGIVERRLRRNLSRHYVPRAEVLTRVRGRIDVFRTTIDRTLERGEIACRFEELSIDTPRNRFVRHALTRASTLKVDRALATRCRSLASHLALAGVTGHRMTERDLRRESFVRHDGEDRLMIELARLVVALALPTQEAGSRLLPSPHRDDVALRKIFERAVGRFYAHHLRSSDGWSVRTGEWLDWPQQAATLGLAALLPRMQTDIVIERSSRRLVIDTKFTGILTSSARGTDRLRSNYLYQLYAYLRSQADRGGAHAQADGLLLHPALNLHLDEAVTIQGHRIRFATLDLMAPTAVIEARLLQLAKDSVAPEPGTIT